MFGGKDRSKTPDLKKVRELLRDVGVGFNGVNDDDTLNSVLNGQYDFENHKLEFNEGKSPEMPVTNGEKLKPEQVNQIKNEIKTKLIAEKKKKN
jgi:hypothetical protein